MNSPLRIGSGRADPFQSGPVTQMAGDLLCAEPLRPCWNHITHARYVRNHGYELTCADCAGFGAWDLPTPTPFALGQEQKP